MTCVHPRFILSSAPADPTGSYDDDCAGFCKCPVRCRFCTECTDACFNLKVDTTHHTCKVLAPSMHSVVPG